MKLQPDRAEVGGLVFERRRGLTQADAGGAQAGEGAAAAPRMRRASFGKAIACGLPAEPTGMPFEGRRLPGYFIRGRSGRAPAPALIAHAGFESTAEELYHWIGAHAADRGWNCLVFEGPGK